MKAFLFCQYLFFLLITGPSLAQELNLENHVKFQLLEEFEVIERESGKKTMFSNGDGVTVTVLVGNPIEDPQNVPAAATLSVATLSKLLPEFELNYEEKYREINGYSFTIYVYSYKPEYLNEREVTTAYFTSHNDKLVNIQFTCSRSQFDVWNDEFGNMIGSIKLL